MKLNLQIQSVKVKHLKGKLDHLCNQQIVSHWLPTDQDSKLKRGTESPTSGLFLHLNLKACAGRTPLVLGVHPQNRKVAF